MSDKAESLIKELDQDRARADARITRSDMAESLTEEFATDRARADAWIIANLVTRSLVTSRLKVGKSSN